MAAKKKPINSPDLFGMLDIDPRWDVPSSPPPPAEPVSEKILTIGSNQYLIRLKPPHPDADPESDDARKQETLPVWQLFIRGTASWQRLRLLGTDPETVPKELIHAAEAMLDWTAGRDWQSQRTLAAQLRPVPDEEGDPDLEIKLSS
jgi:hypothetical protein